MIDFDRVLQKAIDGKASDVHLLKDLRPVYRINRKLVDDEGADVLTDKDLHDAFHYFTRNSEGAKKAFETENKLDMNYEYAETRFRVNISRACGSYTFTARLVRNELPKFSDLGLPDIVKRLSFLPQGLILVTGKSNSGKTTTLNTLVNEINQTENKKILMLENPIEFMHKPNKSLIVQKEVGVGKDCESFEEGVVNALREDCDVLIIGEIRDKDTMEAAIDMAESGHLVIGTMHTKSAAETLDRALNFFEVSDQQQIKHVMSSVLRAVVTQRLIPGKRNNLVMVPEIMIVDDAIAGLMRKERFSKSEIEDAIQTRSERGNISFINSLANAVTKNKIDIQQAYAQLDDHSREMLNRLLHQLKN